MKRKYITTDETKYYIFVLIAFSAVMGNIFVSCQKKEDKNPSNKNVEIIKKTSASKSAILDQTLSNTKSPQKPSVPIKDNEANLIQSLENKNTKLEKTNSRKNSTSKETNSSSKETVVQTNAEFPGGIDQFHTFFMKEYKKPENVNYWKLNFTLAFAVEKNGTISFVECSPAVEPPLEEEIIRVLSLCPKWLPAQLNGKNIRMQYSVPILLK